MEKKYGWGWLETRSYRRGGTYTERFIVGLISKKTRCVFEQLGWKRAERASSRRGGGEGPLEILCFRVKSSEQQHAGDNKNKAPME